MIRDLVGLLDEMTPAIRGCEINDDPFNPLCRHCHERIEKDGDDVEVNWIERERRYGEKLATPDVTIADLIGETDLVKVAEGRYLSDELTMHFGLIPRCNRGLFAINELPDLSPKIQVGLFNLLEERDYAVSALGAIGSQAMDGHGFDEGLLDAAMRGWSVNTRRAFRSDLALWGQWCRFRRVQAAKVRPADVAAWIRALASPNVSATTPPSATRRPSDS